MPKVKVLLTQDVGYGDYDDNYSRAHIREGIADWEDISLEELTFLRANIHRMKKFKADNTGYNNLSPMIIVQDDLPVAERIESIRAEINAEKARDEAERKVRAEKKLEATQKRLAKQAEKDKIKIDALIAEHGKEKAKTIWEFLQTKPVKKAKTI